MAMLGVETSCHVVEQKEQENELLALSFSLFQLFQLNHGSRQRPTRRLPRVFFHYPTDMEDSR